MVEQEVVIQVVLRLMHQLIKVEVVEVLEDQSGGNGGSGVVIIRYKFQ
jgi:hypothetical protein